jgi:hypothetical protein
MWYEWRRGSRAIPNQSVGLVVGEYILYVYSTELPGTDSIVGIQAHQRHALNPFGEDESTHPSPRVGQPPIIPAFTVSPLSSHVQ